jgi:hypothetical protein
MGLYGPQPLVRCPILLCWDLPVRVLLKTVLSSTVIRPSASLTAVVLIQSGSMSTQVFVITTRRTVYLPVSRLLRIETNPGSDRSPPCIAIFFEGTVYALVVLEKGGDTEQFAESIYKQIGNPQGSIILREEKRSQAVHQKAKRGNDNIEENN